MARIADILYRRGDLDEAMRIRREGGASGLRASGRCCAPSLWPGSPTSSIAAAISTRRCGSGGKEELPVFERLGDVARRHYGQDRRHPLSPRRSRRGDADQAGRRSFRSSSVWAMLRAVIMARIADILYRRGDLDEAMRIRREGGASGLRAS